MFSFSVEYRKLPKDDDPRYFGNEQPLGSLLSGEWGRCFREDITFGEHYIKLVGLSSF